MQFSFGKYLLKGSTAQFIYKKQVAGIPIKLNFRKGLLDELFYLRSMFYADFFKTEVRNGFEQYIDAPVFVHLLFGIETLRYITEHKRGVHTMLVGGNH